MSRPFTPAEREIIAELGQRSCVTIEDLALALPDRSFRSARSAVSDYRVMHGLAGVHGSTAEDWTPERRATHAMSEAARQASRVVPAKPRGFHATEIAWAEEHAPAEDEQAILILAHLGHDMRLPGKPPSTEMRA